MTCLLQKQPWQSTIIYTWYGKSIKYQEPPKVFVMSGEIPNHQRGSCQTQDVIN